eukprot:2824948-Alexandrium_andersonii.AAC.1
MAPSRMVTKPSYPEAVVRRSPWPPPRQGSSPCAAVFCCACGGVALHMRRPGCMCPGAPHSRVCPVAFHHHPTGAELHGTE